MRDKLVLEVDVADFVEACAVVHVDQQLDLVDEGARAAPFLFDNKALEVIDCDGALALHVECLEDLLHGPGVLAACSRRSLTQVLLCLLEVQMGAYQPLEHFLCVLAEAAIRRRGPTQKQTRKDSVRGRDEAAPLTVADAAVHVCIVSLENQIALITVVETVADVAVKALAEFGHAHGLEAAEVEHRPCVHAREVNAMSQITLELFDLLFKVDLVQEKAGHLFSNPLLLRPLSERLAARMGVSAPAELARLNLLGLW
eukprot:CAMPEP_0170453114 /NCGR_PEP_ID=MMETSP0123-20130129/1799_1 /TAXON_ID=182087 /ORGANISM="Favella ehrenbergii, Strain Fehren 1" /LENGTH=256 /DNA_ID=CAMNT_0010715369 /DNA_START=61 /DNA_END=828 /DNA_ORIENTATION=+